MRLMVFLCLIFLVAMAVPNRAAGPDESKWLISYPVPEGVKEISVTLSYGFWDPKIDGDVPSEKVLLTTTQVKIEPGQTSIPIQVLLNGGKSVVIVGKHLFRGKGRLLDASFVRATAPKPNYDGFYILAQKPGDPKNPEPMGQVDEASAWIELRVELKP